ncbi:M23 family metallopeptidase [Stenotrophomonas sp. NRRL B-14846]|uniref:M23 family metallopeptidase n=1 Tax=Stenotrophomonas sp. NRRL B-14846 TaxID=3162882 RepID=UPI003D2793E0
MRVAQGQVVRSGAHLGDCGNSGNSSEPHLHYQLQAGPAFGVSAALPAQFSDYVADGRAGRAAANRSRGSTSALPTLRTPNSPLHSNGQHDGRAGAARPLAWKWTPMSAKSSADMTLPSQVRAVREKVPSPSQTLDPKSLRSDISSC